MSRDRLAVVCVRCHKRLTQPSQSPELVLLVLCMDCQRLNVERVDEWNNDSPPDAA